MRRREFIAGWAARRRGRWWQVRSSAARMRRIGILLNASSDDPQYQAWVGAFLQELALLGWAIGRNVRIDTRWAGANAAEFADTRQNWSRSRRTSSWPMAPDL